MSGIYLLAFASHGTAPHQRHELRIGMGDESAEPVAEIIGEGARDIHDHWATLPHNQRDAFIYGVLIGARIAAGSKYIRLPGTEDSEDVDGRVKPGHDGKSFEASDTAGIEPGEKPLPAVRSDSRSGPEGSSVNTRERPVRELPERGEGSIPEAVDVTGGESAAVSYHDGGDA